MKDTKRIKALYNKLIIPIGLDRDLIEELTPSTNHEYISSKYNNKITLDPPIQPQLDTNILRVNNIIIRTRENLISQVM